MAGIDTRFSVAFPLQELFRDKDTGLPLRGGYIKFFEDCDHNTGKEVYKLTGSPGAYTYVSQGVQVDINSAGYLDDVTYYFPYIGTPDTTDGTVDLYYVEIYSSTDVLQNTRQAVPNIGSVGEDSGEDLENFIPNGQFLSHVDIETDGVVDGAIKDAATNVAYGGWTFERNDTSDQDDFITFDRDASWIEDNPGKNPRYRLRAKSGNTGSSVDTYKDLRVKFDDVNKFSSAEDPFTFKFAGRSLSGGQVNVEVWLIKNYGTGGAAEVPVQIGQTITLDTSYGDHFIQFEFGDNDGVGIGSNDDDFIQLALRFPVNAVFDAEVVDFVLVRGDVNDPDYPYITERQDISQFIGGSFPVPAFNSSDLYLPVILGPSGLLYDDSEVGKIYSTGYDTNKIADWELLCDGSSYVSSKKHNGVPLSRLGNKLFRNGVTIPIWGTGLDFSTAWQISTAPSSLYISNNTKGAVTSTADGTAPTNFTFRDAHVGADYGAISYKQDGNQLYIELVAFGAELSAPSAGTSTFGVAIRQVGTSLLKNKVEIAPVAGAGLAGLYFDWSNTATDYRVWYTVDGAGAAPDLTGKTGIEVDVLSTDDAAGVMLKTKLAINGFQESLIITQAVATKPLGGGEFFTFSSTSNSYYVWYTVDGAGTDPAPVGIGIQVDLTSSDDADTVATLTATAIDAYQFAVPDLRGQFLRGVDGGAGIDPDTANRYRIPGVFDNQNGDVIGTCQQSANLSHAHNFQWKDVFFSAGGPTASDNNDTGNEKDTDAAGITESRPINKYVHYVIKI